MFLGIEIGGTKIQLGVGAGDGSPLAALERFEVDSARGAAGILERIRLLSEALLSRHSVAGIGIGFGGPVDISRGRVVKSHQVAGWDDFPLVDWAVQRFGLPVAIGNDADLAALAEARCGAGQGMNPAIYVTVGTGVGAGLVLDGRVYRGSGFGAIELGHLRPGLIAARPEQTVESLASGQGIAAAAQARLEEPLTHEFKSLRGLGASQTGAIRAHLALAAQTHEESKADLLARAGGKAENLTGKIVAQAASEGNSLAIDCLQEACDALGWAIAQVITLLAPAVVVIGGGVALTGEQLFLAPVRAGVDRYVFPPFRGRYRIVPAALGELPVVHGALALAHDQSAGDSA